MMSRQFKIRTVENKIRLSAFKTQPHSMIEKSMGGRRTQLLTETIV